MKKKTVMIASLSSMLFFAGISPSLASANETTNLPTSQGVNATAPFPGVENGNTNNDVQPMWRAKIAKEAIEALADKVDGKYADNIIAELPNKKLRDAFKKSQKGIAKNLRAIAKKGDQAEEYVQNSIVQAIMATGAPSSVANTIANVLVFIFL